MLKKRTFKNHILFVVSIICLLLILSGCSVSYAPTSKDNDAESFESLSDEEDASENDNVQTSDTDDVEEEVSQEENVESIYQIGDSASLDVWTINVTDAKIVDSISGDYGTSFSPKEEGDKLIQVFIIVNNDGKQAANFLPTYGMKNDVSAKILYSDEYEFSATNLLGYSNDLHDSVINPLSSKTGEITFEIPNTVADSDDELLIRFSSGKDELKFKIR